MTTQTESTTIKPTHRLYLVRGTGKAARWTEIGAAWPHRDDKGFSISAEAIALDGRIVMRRITERSAREAA